MSDCISRFATVHRLTKFADILQEPMKSHTILIALYLQNEEDFPTVSPEDDDKIGLICLRCKKATTYSKRTFREISYTHYSYCEECLREGLKLLREKDKGEEYE